MTTSDEPMHALRDGGPTVVVSMDAERIIRAMLPRMLREAALDLYRWIRAYETVHGYMPLRTEIEAEALRRFPEEK